MSERKVQWKEAAALEDTLRALFWKMKRTEGWGWEAEKVGMAMNLLRRMELELHATGYFDEEDE
jgi:hypothetical protein